MKKRTKILLIGVPVLLVVAVILAALAFAMGGPDPAQFMYLLQPQVHAMADQKVVVVEARGDPTSAGGEAFGLLFKTYFKLEGVPKGRGQPAPRARWPLDLNTPKDQWIGRYAMPVPDTVDSLPSTSGLSAKLAKWEYGQVAEILHVGPYSREEPTIRKLTDFIKESGYTITGEHEEEYIKGPGMFFKGNPEKYLTIIRYRIARPSPSATQG